MRKFVLNLTPLLDLLLILLFAYQINTWVHASQAEQNAQKQVEAIGYEVHSLTAKLVDVQEELAKSIKKTGEAQGQTQNLREALQASVDSYELCQRKLSNAVKLLLEIQRQGGIPKETVEKINELVSNASETELKIARELSRYEALGEVLTFVDVFLREDYLAEIATGKGEPKKILVDDPSKLIFGVENALLSLVSPRDVIIVIFRYDDVLVRLRDSMETALAKIVKDRMIEVYPNRKAYLLKEGYSHEK